MCALSLINKQTSPLLVNTIGSYKTPLSYLLTASEHNRFLQDITPLLNTRGWNPMSSPSHTGGQVVPVGGAGRQRCAQSEATIYTATQEGTLGTILGLHAKGKKPDKRWQRCALGSPCARDAGPVSMLADMQPAAQD